MNVKFFFGGRVVKLNFGQLEVARLTDMAAANGLTDESVRDFFDQLSTDRPALVDAIRTEDFQAALALLSPPLH